MTPWSSYCVILDRIIYACSTIRTRCADVYSDDRPCTPGYEALKAPGCPGKKPKDSSNSSFRSRDLGVMSPTRWPAAPSCSSLDGIFLYQYEESGGRREEEEEDNERAVWRSSGLVRDAGTPSLQWLCWVRDVLCTMGYATYERFKMRRKREKESRRIEPRRSGAGGRAVWRGEHDWLQWL
jgi:hypothetical protein